MSTLLNQTKGASSGSSKVDCAKECPCGVPVIPVPDQWLEVMVTGGFKVWHIIFIIIAFVVTLIVVYCCFHRCRIPRTKQEIEADLMRMNIANKFRDYLQELPNEPTSFLEALKKVQDLEEKSEKDDAQMARDAGARKRLGWLKLKGKGDKDGPPKLDGKDDEQTPLEEKPPITTEPEPQKTVIPPEPEPHASVAPPPEPKPVSLGPSVGIDLPGGPPNATDSEQQEPKMRQPKRRKQKPNLSRTKRAKEKWNGDLEGQRPPEVEYDKPPSSAFDKPPDETLPNEKPPHTRRPPKHHTHRVRTEPKIPGPPDV